MNEGRGKQETRALGGEHQQDVASGRVTKQEAMRLRAASSPGEVNEVIREISGRHAGLKIMAAVDDGSMSKDEADAFRDRLRTGEHRNSLRAELRALRS